MTDTGIPISTYRVQFNREFRFLDCRDIVPYLHMLGIGALYSSPRFRARRGSEHGYDVASPLRVNSELGTDEEFADLCQKLHRYGLGLVLDIVPNHMAASHENPWWMDVLENGSSSPYAHYFDIDWHPVISKAAFLQENKVLLPVLGDLYGNVLERGELTLGIEESGFFVRYYERRLPIDPATYGLLLEACREHVVRAVGPDHGAVADLDALRQLAAQIPPRTAADPEEMGRRLRDGFAVRRRTFELYRDHLETRLAMDAALREVSASPDRLHALLEEQAYRLAFWKIAFEEINFRRFFDINDLVSLRVEEEDVFAARHEIIFQLIAEGKVTGLRVDHIDGLRDPETYLARLAARADQAAGEPVYVVVEKILGRGEPLPKSWKTRGTTGYDFLNALNGLFLEPGGLRQMEAIYAQFTGHAEAFSEVCYAGNKQAMRQLFSVEVNTLGHELGKLAARDLEARDVPLSELIGALFEVTACLPTYRTYIRGAEISPGDRARLERTLDTARRRTQDSEIGDSAFAFLRRVLLLDPPPYALDQGPEYLRFVMRWQQFTGPVMAKGLEDTAGYVHNSLISVNEVGGDPLRIEPPLDLDGFHRFLAERLRLWPHTMNATATHDTKRGEDARTRIDVLTELPREWERRLLKWRRLNQRHQTEVNGLAVPTPGEEALLYQTLLGAWPLDPGEEPLFLDRLREFLRKALREAKQHSGWIQPNEAHEEAVLRFAGEIFAGDENPFRKDFLGFQRKIAWHGALNSLAQVLIKITAPGVPDFYQGCELWDMSMVDPDNRRKVDFRRHIEMLEALRAEYAANSRRLLKQMLPNWRDGRIKLYLTDRALDFRRSHAEVYRSGAYVPLPAAGPRQANLCAFARQGGGQWCITVAPRFTTQLAPAGRAPLGEAVWRETRLRLPEGAPEVWENTLTGEAITAETADGKGYLAVSEVLRRFPVALLGAAG